MSIYDTLFYCLYTLCSFCFAVIIINVLTQQVAVEVQSRVHGDDNAKLELLNNNDPQFSLTLILSGENGTCCNICNLLNSGRSHALLIT